MTKTDRRATKRTKSRYGHAGSGSSHTRTASDAEVRRHIIKIRKRGKGKV